MIAASLVAGALVAFRGAEQVVLPIAIVLRSIPLVALTPLLALIFGRGLLGVTVVVAVVTFFATLVTVSQGLRAAPALACEVITSLGGGQVMVTRKVRLLYALPSLFASARIAIPGAIAAPPSRSGSPAAAGWAACSSRTTPPPASRRSGRAP